MRVLSPIVNKEWTFVCHKCPYVPYGTRDEIGERYQIDGSKTWIMIDTELENGVMVNVYYPKRCKECETKKKRNQRMRLYVKRAFRVSDDCEELIGTRYKTPKLITFADLNDEYYSSSCELRLDLIEKLNKKAPKFLKRLGEWGVLGGTYVIECNTRLIWSDLAVEPQQWRHHPHVHMAAIAPYIQRKRLRKFCECLMDLGLGRINYKAKHNHYVVADYMGKYLVKEGRNARTFGRIMMKQKLRNGDCTCKHEDMEVNYIGTCECMFEF